MTTLTFTARQLTKVRAVMTPTQGKAIRIAELKALSEG
ncbi:hypothetical protein MBENS4_2655 [Novosphingobium sp. MBES04]|nr:hypothetical protein MBENS4_2655 [Novosphingobium sp. MBES04]